MQFHRAVLCRWQKLVAMAFRYLHREERAHEQPIFALCSWHREDGGPSDQFFFTGSLDGTVQQWVLLRADVHLGLLARCSSLAVGGSSEKAEGVAVCGHRDVPVTTLFSAGGNRSKSDLLLAGLADGSSSLLRASSDTRSLSGAAEAGDSMDVEGTRVPSLVFVRRLKDFSARCLSDDASLAVGSSQWPERALTVYDVQRSHVLRKIPLAQNAQAGVSPGVTACCLSPDRNVLCAATNDGVVSLYDQRIMSSVEDGGVVDRYQVHNAVVRKLCWMEMDQSIVSCCDDGAIVRWSLPNKFILRVFPHASSSGGQQPHSQEATAAVSPAATRTLLPGEPTEGDRAIGGLADRQASARPLPVMDFAMNEPRSEAQLFETTLASVTADGAMHVWDFARGEQEFSFQAHRDIAWGVALSWDSSIAVTCGQDCALRTYEIPAVRNLFE